MGVGLDGGGVRLWATMETREAHKRAHTHSDLWGNEQPPLWCESPVKQAHTLTRKRETNYNQSFFIFILCKDPAPNVPGSNAVYHRATCVGHIGACHTRYRGAIFENNDVPWLHSAYRWRRTGNHRMAGSGTRTRNWHAPWHCPQTMSSRTQSRASYSAIAEDVRTQHARQPHAAWRKHEDNNGRADSTPPNRKGSSEHPVNPESPK